MEVYIEYVILDNLIINYVLLRLTNKTIKLKAKKSDTAKAISDFWSR